MPRTAVLLNQLLIGGEAHSNSICDVAARILLHKGLGNVHNVVQ